MLKLNKLKVLANRSSLNLFKATAKPLSTSTFLQQKLSYEQNQYDKLDIIGTTVGDALTKIAVSQPNDVAYKFCMTQQSFTFSEVKQRVDELAQNLLNMGFIKGDNIAIFLPNLPETALVTLACGSIGARAVLMNPAYKLFELEHMLKKTKAKGIFILDNTPNIQHYEMLKKLCPEIETCQKGELKSVKFPYLKHVIVTPFIPSKDTESKFKGTWIFNEVKQHNTVNSVLPYVDIDDICAMMFTSGTTGLPKAATIGHSAILNTARFIHKFSGCTESFKNTCIPIPIFHMFGFTTGLMSPLMNGNKVIFPHLIPDTLSTIKAIHAEKCKSIKGAPTIYMDIINHPELKNYDMSSLETMLVGASTVPRDLLFKVKDTLGIKNVIVGCAMTETSCAGTFTNMNDINVSERAAYDSIGRNFLETKIINPETNEIVPRNVDGEMCFRGYGIMKGYFDDPEKTAETIDSNGWLKTGDVACMDEDGYIFFKSRSKEIVIKGGINIYPSEIEAFLRTNQSVLDCYVIGIPDERLGEEICVWVKLNPNEKVLTKDEVREYCKGNLAHFKVPKYVKFVDAFPVSATAKVQKFKMVEQMKEEMNLQ